MAKYIDAEKLKAKIEKTIKSIESCPFIEAEFGAAEKREGKIQAYKEILSSIDSLQKEEPTEIDLEKEVEKYFQGYWPGMETAEQCNTDMHFTPLAIMRLVKYFYELGKEASNES